MKNIKGYKPGLLFFFLGIFGFVSAQKAVFKNGTWQAVIHRSDGNEIHFTFFAREKNNKQLMTIINGEERLQVDDIKKKGDSVFITLPFFSSAIHGKLVSENNFRGIYIKKFADHQQEIPVEATFGVSERYKAYKKPLYNVSGTWDVLFLGTKNKPVNAVGNFVQTVSGKVTGSFLTPTGDYRFLEGIVSGDTLILSGFDGGFASYFRAILKNDSTIEKADFYSGAAWHDTWSAVKNDKARLPDEYSYSHLRPGETGLNFSFPDTKGNTVSVNDQLYKGKVLVVQILGSWCPNCLDETAFLSDYYKKNKARGVEVIGLAYERTGDYASSKKALEPFQKRFDVRYPVLITGVTPSDSLRTEKTLPQIDRISAFPTTIFIDKKGNVRKIHTGYDGPGTGKFYEAFKKEFEELISELLNEKP